MKELSRADYYLAYHGWDDKTHARVWLFKGPVDIYVIESSDTETVADAYKRLQVVIDLKKDDWQYGEAPRFMTSSQCSPHSQGFPFPEIK